MKLSLLTLGFCLLLTSCLTQDATEDPVEPPKDPVEGIVSIEDSEGAITGAAIFGIFETKGPSKTRRFGSLLNTTTEPSKSRETRCREVKKDPLERASRNLVSAGDLKFGQALHSTFLSVDETSDHFYYRELDGNVASGPYSIIAKGSDLVPGFEGYVSVPDWPRALKGNDLAFEDQGIEFSRSEGLTLSWESSGNGTEGTLVAVDVIVKANEAEKMTLSCEAEEATLQVEKGRALWKLPVSNLEKLPSSDVALIKFVRATLAGGKLKNLTLYLQGVRASVSPAIVH